MNPTIRRHTIAAAVGLLCGLPVYVAYYLASTYYPAVVDAATYGTAAFGVLLVWVVSR